MLIKELWEASDDNRCPFVEYNGERCNCKAIDSEIVCDSASLQLWCLNPKRYKFCSFYPKEEINLFWSSGPLRYIIDNSGYKLNVMVDKEIVNYYRSLIPKYMKSNSQAYSAHISVVRKEMPPNLDLWDKYEGEEVQFAYSNVVHYGRVYCWLNVFCKRLEEIRIELGLPVSSEYTRPPDGYAKAFHITLGNFK